VAKGDSPEPGNSSNTESTGVNQGSSNPQVGQSSVPAAGEGSNIQDVNSPKFQKRMGMAQYLQNQLDQELADRAEKARLASINPRFINNKITMKDLNFTFV
jgi:hypothetical protein